MSTDQASTSQAPKSGTTIQVIAEKLSANVYQMVSNKNESTSQSSIWQIFAKIKTDTGMFIENFVVCSKCSKIFVFTDNIWKLLKHKCYVTMKLEKTHQIWTSIELKMKENLERICLQWTIDNCRPIDTIEDSWTQKLDAYLRNIGTRFGQHVNMEDILPETVSISQYVQKLYANYFEEVKTELKWMQRIGYGLTIDVWSADQLDKSYVFLAIHYIKNEKLENRFLGMHRIQSAIYTSDDIKSAAEEILKKFDCALDDKAIIVTDKGEIMMEAFKSNNRIYCLNYLLQSAMDEAIFRTPEIGELLETCTKLYNFLTSVSDLFTISDQFVSQRWETDFRILSSLADYWNEALEISKGHEGEESRIIENLNLQNIIGLLKIYNVYELPTKDLDCGYIPTIHLAVIHVKVLERLYANTLNNSDIIKKFKENLLEVLGTFFLSNMTIHHKIALYLFPALRELIMLSPNDKELVRAECKRIMQRYVDEEPSVASLVYATLQAEHEQLILGFLNMLTVRDIQETNLVDPAAFADFVIPYEGMDNAEEKINNEIRAYEDTNVTDHDSFNPLNWWDVYKPQFPLLYRICCKIFAVPATAEACKAIIEKAIPLIFKCESRDDDLHPTFVNDVLFLHFNVEKSKLFYKIMEENFEKFVNIVNQASTSQAPKSGTTIQVIAEKLSANVYQMVSNKNESTSQSSIWQIFAKIKTDTGMFIENFVVCSKCSKIFVFTDNIWKLLKHKCYVTMKLEKTHQIWTSIELKMKENLERICLQWTIDNCRPIDTIEDSWTQQLAAYLRNIGTRFGQHVNMEDILPETVSISEYVQKLYANYFEEVKTELKWMQRIGYGLTIDVWSADQLDKSYVFLAIHYIKNEKLENRFLGMHRIQSAIYTSDDIKSAAEEILKKFDCALDDKAIIVTDKGEIMMEAFKSNNRIYCLNYLLQSAMDEAIFRTPEIGELLETCRKLYNFLTSVSDLFTISDQFISQRWETDFRILSSLADYWNEALEISKGHEGEESRIIENLNLQNIIGLLKIYNIYELPTKDLDCDYIPSIHLAVIHVKLLERLYANTLNNSDIIKKFKENLLEVLGTFFLSNMTIHHKIALYLFPALRELIMLSPNDKELVRAECKRIMQRYVDEEPSVASLVYATLQAEHEQLILGFLNMLTVRDIQETNLVDPAAFADFVIPYEGMDNAEEKINNEIRAYEDTNVTDHDSFNPLNWWDVYKPQFPLLYRICCKIFAVPATAEACKAIIEKAIPLIFKCESRDDDLHPTFVNDVLFLHFNVEKSKLFYKIMGENFEKFVNIVENT
ncbi:uncharacterized protein LOC128858685 [Anastrepha ludens]|uniref:uncharacterized protein LOC128858685 n=1 Tax=Anastrepha ludens TaxID=28586 RepID=UPI0023B04DA8|nr:uncharacterized protein LOC128858685 [Anastrepha ludens]